MNSSGSLGAAWGDRPGRDARAGGLLGGHGRMLIAGGSAAVAPTATAGCIIRRRRGGSIQLFMNGGVSQMDTFDYKPELHRRHGQPFDPGSTSRPRPAPGQTDEEPVHVPAIWRMRPMGQQRVSRACRAASTSWRS